MKKSCIFLLVLMLLLSLALAGCSQPTAENPPAENPPAAEQPEEQESKEEKKIEYPTEPIQAYVGFPAGGATDLIARGVLPLVQEELGIGIGITNMVGAASAQAAQHVLDQAPDGYTIFFGSEIMSIWQTMGTIDLNPTRDFIPVYITTQAVPVLAVPPDSPFNSAEEFIQYAKDHPGELRIGTAGPGTVPHISGLVLQSELGCEFTFVPFQGSSAAITGVMSGEIDATIEMVQTMVEAHKGNKLKILATFTNEPVEGLEDIATMGTLFTELSDILPYGPYFGVFVSKDTPQEIVDVLRESVGKVLDDQRWIDYCNNLYLIRADYSGEEAYKFCDEWTSRAAWLLYDAGGGTSSPEDFGIERLQ